MAGMLSQLPLDRLKKEAQGLGQALGERGLSQAGSTVESLTGRLNDIAEGKGTMPRVAKGLAEGDSPIKAGGKAVAEKVKDKVKSAFGGGGSGGGKLKVTNIVESVDVPVSRDVAYQQWTRFEDFPSFMKKVENVKQEEDNVTTWQAQIFWSHRRWKSTIVDQVPNERIVWKSEAEKGRVDGAVTFHELAPDLTRILLTLEYHPKGLFEHTGNIWRAQGRRVRLELKHFRRHVANNTLLHQDELEGWPGEIHDGEVTSEDASQEADQEGDEEQEPEDREGERSEDEGSRDEDAEAEDAEDEGEAKPKKRSAAKRSRSSSSKDEGRPSGRSGNGSRKSASSGTRRRSQSRSS